MSVKKEEMFTVGQFARLHHINKRTLQYYSDIGLFEPAYIGDNGYRYYTYQQCMTLEMLLTLRELGMPIEEIQAYMENRSPCALQNIIAQQKEKIRETRKRLDEIDDLLSQSERLITISQQVDLQKISIIECQQEWLLCGRKMQDSQEDYWKAFAEHIQSMHVPRLYNRTYGSMISLQKILDGNCNDDDCFYTKIPSPKKTKGLFCKPKGRYIRAYSQGDWDRLPKVFADMFDFSRKLELELTGYAYEEGINEMTIHSMDEYILQIDIQVKES